MLKLFKVSVINSNKTIRYDYYDSILVCAEDEYDARRIHPYNNEYYWDDSMQFWRNRKNHNFIDYPDENVWCLHLDQLMIEYLGEADAKFTTQRILMSSYNAG